MRVIELPISSAISSPRSLKCPVSIELLDAIVSKVNDIDKAPAVYRNAMRVIELPITCAVTSPSGLKNPISIKLLDSMFYRVSNIHMASIVYCYSQDKTEIPRLFEGRPHPFKLIGFL